MDRTQNSQKEIIPFPKMLAPHQSQRVFPRLDASLLVSPRCRRSQNFGMKSPWQQRLESRNIKSRRDPGASSQEKGTLGCFAPQVSGSAWSWKMDPGVALILQGIQGMRGEQRKDIKIQEMIPDPRDPSCWEGGSAAMPLFHRMGN